MKRADCSPPPASSAMHITQPVEGVDFRFHACVQVWGGANTWAQRVTSTSSNWGALCGLRRARTVASTPAPQPKIQHLPWVTAWFLSAQLAAVIQSAMMKTPSQAHQFDGLITELQGKLLLQSANAKGQAQLPLTGIPP